MRKVFVFGMSGVGSLYLGILAWYLFLVSLNTLPNYYLLGGSVLLINGSAFLFYKATNTKNAYGSSDKTTADIDSPQVEKMLERNNEIAKQWKKTSDQRDKMKMLEIAANAKKS